MVWDLLASTSREGEAPLAKWIERRIGEKDKTIAYLMPARLAARRNWQRTYGAKAAGVVLDFATLRSLGSFDLILRQTGLIWLPQTTTFALQSPFDFAQQGELYLPPILANPKDSAAHTDAVIEWLPKLISTQEAIGTLVLFTSRKQ